MNKFVNILLLILLLPTVGVVIFVGFDLPIEFLRISGANLPYKQEIFFVFAALILIVGGRRSIRRWVGLRMVSQTKRYIWNQPMHKTRVKQAVMYLNLEAFMHVFFAVATYVVCPEAWVISAVMALLAVDHFVFGIMGKFFHKFRVGITKSAIVFSDRDIKVAYFSGLRKVSTQQQSLFFDYIKELQIAVPSGSIAPQNRKEFRETIEAIVNRDVVFFSESFKSFENQI